MHLVAAHSVVYLVTVVLLWWWATSRRTNPGTLITTTQQRSITHWNSRFSAARINPLFPSALE
jgi:hypothetical protein